MPSIIADTHPSTLPVLPVPCLMDGGEYDALRGGEDGKSCYAGCAAAFALARRIETTA